MHNIKNNIKIKSKWPKYFVAFFLFFFISKANANKNLNIYAEANLAPAMVKIAKIFSTENNVVTSLNFDSSINFIENLNNGDSFNVFVSANVNTIESLKQKGLIDVYNIVYIASDRLLLVCKKENMLPINMVPSKINISDAIKIIDDYKLNLIINHENTSEGFYSQKLIDSSNFNNLKLFIKLQEDRSSLIKDIEDNNDSFGLIFASQLQNNKTLRIIASDQEKSYQAMAVAGNDMKIARQFLKFLKSDIAEKIFSSYGLSNN
jgi:molybdate transport system substrate-binding protein